MCPTVSGTNHAIVLVGYGHDSGTNLDFWKVRNSWNTWWGDKGFAKIEITSGDGVINVQSYVGYPLM